MTISRKDRALGMLLGLHAGDSLGATMEFEEARESEYWHREITGGGAFLWRPGQATDDTDLMICVLRALEKNELSFERLKVNFLRWFEDHPPDVGHTTCRGLTMLRRGIPLEECGDGSEHSQGNGSLMRCAPLALLDIDDANLERMVSMHCRITHAHPRCVAADWILVSSLRLLLAGVSKEEVYRHALKIAKERDELLFCSLAEIDSTPWDDLKTSGYVLETLGAGFWGLLFFESMEDSVVSVVNCGQDADTCGAVAGYHGWKAIPERWLGKLEQRTIIEEMVGRFWGMAFR